MSGKAALQRYGVREMPILIKASPARSGFAPWEKLSREETNVPAFRPQTRVLALALFMLALALAGVIALAIGVVFGLMHSLPVIPAARLLMATLVG